jgi:hypothetical protein
MGSWPKEFKVADYRPCHSFAKTLGPKYTHASAAGFSIMQTAESKWRNIGRTVVCLGGGIFLSFFLSAALEMLLQPKPSP